MTEGSKIVCWALGLRVFRMVWCHRPHGLAKINEQPYNGLRRLGSNVQDVFLITKYGNTCRIEDDIALEASHSVVSVRSKSLPTKKRLKTIIILVPSPAEHPF
jgi:hypothetical protein